MIAVLFACIQNAGRSQMAAAFFNDAADPAKARATSAGTQPSEMVHVEVRDAMMEVGLDLSRATPRLLTPDLAGRAQMLITMGCGDACPVLPGVRTEDWALPDPSGKSAEEVRQIRDEIRRRVVELIATEGWN